MAKKYMRVEYSVKNVGKTADEVRQYVIDKLGIECFVALHPNRLKITFSSPIPEEGLEIIDQYVIEEFDGTRVVTK